MHLLRAVAFLHDKFLIHRDIKLSNLLYTNQGILKLADFGLSRPYADAFQSQLTLQVASLWYRAPELLLGSTSYSRAIDLWAVGCIFGEISTGQPLMQGKSEVDQIHKVFDCVGVSQHSNNYLRNLPLIRTNKVQVPSKSRRTLLDALDNQLSRQGLDLVYSLLQFDPQERIKAAQALKSQFFVEPPVPTATKDMPVFPRSFQN